MANRVIETNLIEEDIKIEGSLRPQTLNDYIGQSKIKENLRIYIEAAKPCAVLWSSRVGEDFSGGHYRE